MVIAANAIGKDLLQALGLPKRTKAFSLHARVGELVRVECEYYPDDGRAITTALMQYDLVPRRAPAPAPATYDFDTWYRKRIDVAHAKFMERTSYHVPSDWRVFPPEAIAAYIAGCR